MHLFPLSANLVFISLQFFIFLAFGEKKSQAPDNTLAEQVAAHDLLLITVATSETDGYRRWLRAANEYSYRMEVLGLDTDWKGGDMAEGAGGGQKIRLLKGVLEKYKSKTNLIVLFTDAYDVILNAAPTEVLEKFFNNFPRTRVLFSAEKYCWPDSLLSTVYPLVSVGKRYLNSGMFLGYASNMYDIVTFEEIGDKDDDQRYYTKVFLDKAMREKHNIALDSESLIFQNLHGAEEDVQFEYTEDGTARLTNTQYSTNPLMVHGNGLSKWRINQLGNYVGQAFNEHTGCLACRKGAYLLGDVKTRDFPMVTMVLAITRPTPFLDVFFERAFKLDYPKHRMNLIIYNSVKEHQKTMAAATSPFEGEFSSFKTLLLAEYPTAAGALNKAVEITISQDSDYMFFLEPNAHLTNDQTLRNLIQIHRPIVAPMMTQKGITSTFSNFWGAVAADGFYARSNDYLAFTTRNIQGEFNVPYISAAYLVHATKLVPMEEHNAYSYNMKVDFDMSLCNMWRDNGDFMFVDNIADYGYLVDDDEFVVEGRLHPDLWNMFANKEMWEAKYLNPSFYPMLNGEEPYPEPCPDVFDFPLVTKKFCAEFIEELEHNGQWSSGKNKDDRINGGYENVPTRDIHMNQLDYHRQMEHLLQDYVRPVQEKVYAGYFHNPIDVNIMFVVRYRPDEQASLRPHNDASTWSIDLALNERGKDFQGGGVRFVRHNCSVLDHEVGWSLIFPGRLTHLHEGLPVTGGTRYIGVAFVNP